MKVITKGGADKVVIMAIREGLVQPFDAPGWLDLRVGFLLSITDDTADDDPTTALAETVGADPSVPQDRYYIGVKTRGTLLPLSAGTSFIGWTNQQDAQQRGLTKLVSSDAGIGTTNAFFWRPQNSVFSTSFRVFDGVQRRGTGSGDDGLQQHFAQDVTGAGGYATLLIFRITRPNTTSKAFTITAKKGTHSGDIAYTSTPTSAYLISQLEATQSPVETIGPIALTTIPDAIFLYWPFRSSRLRVHAMGVLKAS